MGLLPDPGARALVEQADVVLALGTSFGSASTAEWTMRIDGALIHIDIDPASLGQHYRADLALRADVRSFLTSLIEVAASLPGLGPPRPRPPSPAPVSHPWIDPIEAALPARGRHHLRGCDYGLALVTPRRVPGAGAPAVHTLELHDPRVGLCGRPRRASRRSRRRGAGG